MSDDPDPEEPLAIGAQRDRRVWSALGDLVTGVRLPPDLIQTWGERVPAVVALFLIGLAALRYLDARSVVAAVTPTPGGHARVPREIRVRPRGTALRGQRCGNRGPRHQAAKDDTGRPGSRHLIRLPSG